VVVALRLRRSAALMVRRYRGRVVGPGNLSSTRVSWQDLPSGVREEIERVVGASVRSATTIHSGFSPGLLARLGLSNGLEVFAKVCPSSMNPRTPLLHTREAQVMAGLAESVAAVRLVGAVQHGEWSGIVTEFFAGAQAGLTDESIRSARQLADSFARAPVPETLERHTDLLSNDFLWFGLRRLMDRDGCLPSQWSNANSDRLVGLESEMVSAVEGNNLVHGDLRADNVLVNSDGLAVAVDWPAAAVGNPLFDQLTLLASLALVTDRPAAAVAAVAAVSAQLETADPALVTTLLVGLYGHYLWASTLGNPPGIPGVRFYQSQLAVVLEHWLRARL
jgi:Phosphotransferase enzyme family